jgi:hypothetical protein
MRDLQELTDDHVKSICRPGTSKCCRFLMMGPAGWDCGKFQTIAGFLNRRVAMDDMRADGDNCEGRIAIGDLTKHTKQTI